MPWDGDDLAGKMEENLERQQAAAEARANKQHWFGGRSSPVALNSNPCGFPARASWAN